jgi:cell wall assembly regulator SMI1
MVPTLIERLDRWLAANRPDYYARLQPGVTSEALNAFEARFSLKMPQAFRLLYEWRNGQEPQCSASLQDNRMWLSLDGITETKAMLDGMIGLDFDDPHWWRKGWVPFLSNGGGDYLCLNLTAEDGGQPGQVIAFWHDWENRSVKYPSFEAWLVGLVDSMENGTLKLR